MLSDEQKFGFNAGDISYHKYSVICILWYENSFICNVFQDSQHSWDFSCENWKFYDLSKISVNSKVSFLWSIMGFLFLRNDFDFSTYSQGLSLMKYEAMVVANNFHIITLFRRFHSWISFLKLRKVTNRKIS